MLVEFTLSINGNPIYVNPNHVACVYGDTDMENKSYIEMTGYVEEKAFGVIGTPDEVAAKLNGEAK